MPTGVWTGLEPRTSVGPLASDVGLKETHLLVDPGLSLGHLRWCLARLLLGQLASACLLHLFSSLSSFLFPQNSSEYKKSKKLKCVA